jgi:hypothetical protein
MFYFLVAYFYLIVTTIDAAFKLKILLVMTGMSYKQAGVYSS